MLRIFTFIQLIFSYLLSVILQKPIHRGFPVHVSIEPTNHCNLRCPECPTGQRGLTRPVGALKLVDFKRFLDQFPFPLSWLTLYFQGEPYLNQDLFDMISTARSRKIYVWTSTNGHFLTENNVRKTIESGLNKLVISLDGTDHPAYEQYRIGGSFETVVEGIKNVVRIRKELGTRKPSLEIQFLVLKSNEHQVQEIRKLGNSLGVDRVVLKTAQFYDFNQGNPLMPEEGRWSRYKRTNGQKGTRALRHKGTRALRYRGTEAYRKTYQSPVFGYQSQVIGHGSRVTDPKFVIKNPLPNRCFRLWSGCVVTWDGRVVPCCFDKDASHCMGDLNAQPFEEIWRGEKYREFRKNLFINRKSIDICRNCNQRW